MAWLLGVPSGAVGGGLALLFTDAIFVVLPPAMVAAILAMFVIELIAESWPRSGGEQE